MPLSMSAVSVVAEEPAAGAPHVPRARPRVSFDLRGRRAGRGQIGPAYGPGAMSRKCARPPMAYRARCAAQRARLSDGRGGRTAHGLERFTLRPCEDRHGVARGAGRPIEERMGPRPPAELPAEDHANRV